jgi:hypothetical protein
MINISWLRLCVIVLVVILLFVIVINHNISISRYDNIDGKRTIIKNKQDIIGKWIATDKSKSEIKFKCNDVHITFYDNDKFEALNYWGYKCDNTRVTGKWCIVESSPGIILWVNEENLYLYIVGEMLQEHPKILGLERFGRGLDFIKEVR